MRQLTDSEMTALSEARQEYEPTYVGYSIEELQGFGSGFVAALEYSDAQIAALQADNAKLRAACESALDWLVRFSLHSPIAFGGEAELGDELTEAVARRVLEPPTN